MEESFKGEGKLEIQLIVFLAFVVVLSCFSCNKGYNYGQCAEFSAIEKINDPGLKWVSMNVYDSIYMATNDCRFSVWQTGQVIGKAMQKDVIWSTQKYPIYKREQDIFYFSRK